MGLFSEASLHFRANPLGIVEGCRSSKGLTWRLRGSFACLPAGPCPPGLCSFLWEAEAHRLHSAGPNQPGAWREEEGRNQSFSSSLPRSGRSPLGSHSCQGPSARVPALSGFCKHHLLSFNSQSQNGAIFLWLLLSRSPFTQVCPSVSSNAFITSFLLLRFLE